MNLSSAPCGLKHSTTASWSIFNPSTADTERFLSNESQVLGSKPPADNGIQLEFKNCLCISIHSYLLPMTKKAGFSNALVVSGFFITESVFHKLQYHIMRYHT